MLLYRTAGDHDYRVVPVETLYVLLGHLFEFLYTNGCVGAYGFSLGRAHPHLEGVGHHWSSGSASRTSLPVRTSSTPDQVRRGPGRKSAVRKSREYRDSEKG